jgi:peptidoglycan hydrolase-like protein with peptidoglycan-binding domain
MTKYMTLSKVSQSYVIGPVALVVAVVMMSLPVYASAATLYRQLQLGMSGSDVSDLQTFLARDNTIYPQGLVTGYFGSLTKSAVSNFQARNGIATVGRVGPVTMVAINNQMNGNTNPGNNYGPAPVIGPLSLSISNTSATFSWNTTTNAAAIIYYSTSPISMIEGSPTSQVTIGGTSYLVHTELKINHSGTLSGLSPNTTYYYVVYVRDGFGNENITWPATFRTNN